MKIHFRTLRGFVRKEFIQIIRDKKMIMAIFFVPVMQLTMFGLALTSEVKNIEFVVVSKPSRLSRAIQDKALASGWFKPVNIDGAQVADPALLIVDKKAEAVLVAPKEGLEYALERGGKPLQLLINATNAQRAQQVDAYVRQIIAQTARENGYNLNADNLIQMDIRIMFNHYMNTSSYMLPALTAMATFIVIMMVCSMSLAKEKEVGTMEKLISSPANAAEILLGKTLPYLMIGLCIVLFMFSVSYFGFGIPFRGHFWQMLVSGFVMLVTALSLATLISTFVKTQQQAMMAAILFIMPAILLSGVFFPVENIPAVFRWISYLNPLTYAMYNFRIIFLKGGDLALYWQYSLIALGMGLVLAAAAFKNFKSKLN